MFPATWLELDDNGDEGDENNNRRQRIYFDNQRPKTSHFHINNFLSISHGCNVNLKWISLSSCRFKFHNISSKQREFSIMILVGHSAMSTIGGGGEMYRLIKN